MKAAMQHIDEQLAELAALTDPHDQRHIRAMIHGMCMAYYRAGSISMIEWDAVSVEINKREEKNGR